MPARISGLILTALCASLAVPFSVIAQTFPSKPVRMVVPSPAGGGIDIMARQFAARFSPQWAQPVVVENRPGSSTIVGTEIVAKAPADGHTLLLTTDASMSINPHLFAKLPYDPARDFAPVTMLVLLQQMLLATPSLGVSTVADLVKLAKTRPGSINYASYGSGSQPHLAGEMLKSAAGIDLVHIPYKGISLAVPAVAAGEVQLTFGGILTSMSFIKSGRVKPLAIGGTKRSPLLPDVPTFAEVGFPEVETHAWFALFVPAATPRPVVERINRDAVAIVNDPEYRQKELVDKGYDPVGNRPEEFAAFMKRDLEGRGRAVKLSGARAE